MMVSGLAPWLCWALPTVASVFPVVLRGVSGRTKGVLVTAAASLSWGMALSMLPGLTDTGYVERGTVWFTLPAGGSVGLGMLIDPLSIILANVVSFLSLLILVYSLRYVEHDPGADRYWFFMSFFIGGMLLLILADNLILFFVGWKIVGLCSYGLIGHYYHDDRKYWIGGPPPFPSQRPSRCGLKALLVTSLGDVSLLASTLIIYTYAGTFNFMELYQTADVWLAAMAQNSGVLTLTIVLFLAGPLAKSAQFPFHEWLPEAMAGPAPVSALIHAATMVKAGVYLVARVLPIFYFAAWVSQPSYPEALTFFVLVAAIGGFSALLAGTQAVVAMELKKVLAYSTMSTIGYMMLALGVAGLSPESLVGGVSAGIFYLISHGIFKAALFLCAGVAIHASGSIYITEMRLSRRRMRLTWAFMWISVLALMGVPPLSGFWSKDEVLLSCLVGGQYALFALASATVAFTAFYGVRLLGIMFHSGRESEGGGGNKDERGEEPSRLMLLPYAILAILTVAIGLAGPWVGEMIHGLFGGYFTSLGLVAVSHTHSTASGAAALPVTVSMAVAMVSVLMVVAGGVPAYLLYVAKKSSAAVLLERHAWLRAAHSFLWSRWYMDAAINRVFVRTTLAARGPFAKYAEGSLDRAINVGIPALISSASRGLRRIQTGVLSVNMLYFMAFLVLLILLLLWQEVV